MTALTSRATITLPVNALAAAPSAAALRPAHLSAVSNEPAAARSKPRLRSDQLFAGTEEIEIEHGSAIYRLRITSLGKLILTK